MSRVWKTARITASSTELRSGSGAVSVENEQVRYLWTALRPGSAESVNSWRR